MSKEDDAPKMVLDEVYNDPEADFTLVSSDNIGFKVFKYLLQAHSPVFRDMMSTCSTDISKIEFADTFIEGSNTIRLFLDLVNNKPPDTTWETIGTHRTCVLFLRKFECQILLSLLRDLSWGFFLQGDDNPDISVRYIYVLAAELECIPLAAQAIRMGEEWKMPDPYHFIYPANWFTGDQEELAKTKGPLGISEGGGALDPAAWPVWELPRVPYNYLAALMKVNRKHPLGQGLTNGEEAAKYFTELMTPS